MQRWGEARGLGEVRLFELSNAAGMRVVLSDLGATIVSWLAPDREGRLADVLLGHNGPDGYLDSPAYLGGTIGRWANRIGGHGYTWQGRHYRLDANEGEVTLHGGHHAFHHRKWQASEDAAGVRFTLRSPDGDAGFPGTVDAQVHYALADDGTLRIELTAEADQLTPLNLTNHAYFNLAGAAGPGRPTILDHRITIAADRYVQVDGQMITTAIAAVDGTVFDLRRGARIGDQLDASDPQVRLAAGIDHCFLLAPTSPGSVRPAATLVEPLSGRTLWVATDAPGLQFYTGNRLAGVNRRPDGAYRVHEGLCLEPGAIPDALNFEGPEHYLVGPGRPYRNRIHYRLGVTP